MSISNQMNVQSKPHIDIKDNAKKNLSSEKVGISTEEVTAPPKNEAVATQAQATLSVEVSQYNAQSQTRNISFKVNEDSKEVYVEITNDKDEVVRTIPTDENDPKFMELIQQSTPGMIINDKG